jgi:hypothetical protein
MKRIYFLVLMSAFMALAEVSGQSLPGLSLKPGDHELKTAESISGSYPLTIDCYNRITGNWAADKKVTVTYTGRGATCSSGEYDGFGQITMAKLEHYSQGTWILDYWNK